MSDRSNSVLTPRRVVAAFAIVLFFAFIASWSSLPARAGSSAATQSLPAPRQPKHLLATRTGTVYPLELPPATASVGRHSRPFRVADPVAYRLRKAAIDSGAMLPALPSLATLALTATTPTFSTTFTGLAFPDSDCGPDCEPPDTQVAAGPNNIFEVTNIVGRLFDKSGNRLGASNSIIFSVLTPIFLQRSKNPVRHACQSMVRLASDSRYHRYHHRPEWLFRSRGLEGFESARRLLHLFRRDPWRLSGSAVARIQRRQSRDRRQLVFVQSRLR